MKTANPKVSVLLSVYKPNPAWLKEQLISLNKQTYGNIELAVYDDCPSAPLDEEVLKQHITAFPYTLIRGEKNIGSTASFAKLTEIAAGDYISYCDQDDIWCEDKIERMVNVLSETSSPLVCSDMYIIDKDGNKTANSITEIRKRHIFYDGEGLAERLVLKNFVTGCALMIKSDIAKSALPFPNEFVHDEWLAICAALQGKIEVIREPLLGYRQHGKNQTGVLFGVFDKESYFSERILKYSERTKVLKSRLYETSLREMLDGLTEFYSARERYFRKASLSDMKIMLRYKKYGKSAVYLELLMKLMPKWLFKKVINGIKSGKL